MTRRQRLTLFTAILGSAVVTVDSSVINVALPRSRTTWPPIARVGNS